MGQIHFPTGHTVLIRGASAQQLNLIIKQLRTNRQQGAYLHGLRGLVDEMEWRIIQDKIRLVYLENRTWPRREDAFFS
jgi:argininosuccinate synthase